MIVLALFREPVKAIFAKSTLQSLQILILMRVPMHYIYIHLHQKHT